MLAAGHEVLFDRGDELFREGEPADLLWILLEGQIQLVRGSVNETIVLATMSTPGQWAGGLRAWGDASSSAGYRATGIAVTDGRTFNVPSEDLGRLVGEWFPFGKHMVIGVYQTVRGIEATARQRESLVALGTLAAGLAHEINNPAAASLRAVEALRETCDADAVVARRAWPRRRSPPSSTWRSIGCAGELAERSVVDDGPIATMDREEVIGNWLDGRGGRRRVADRAAVRLRGRRSRLVRGSRVASSGPTRSARRWRGLPRRSARRHCSSELTDTTNRIAHLVEAVKSYSQMDRAALQTHRRARRDREHARHARSEAQRHRGRSSTSAPISRSSRPTRRS